MATSIKSIKSIIFSFQLLKLGAREQNFTYKLDILVVGEDTEKKIEKIESANEIVARKAHTNLKFIAIKSNWIR
jgi:hypothetical protein